MSGFYSKNNRELGSQVPDFLHVCICPGDICPYQQYLSCYWPDLDQILNKGSWEHIQQITTVTTTFVQATFVLGIFVHISNINISKLNTFDYSLVEMTILCTNFVLFTIS